MRIAFLFGAGISTPLGVSSTIEITKEVMSGKCITTHTEENVSQYIKLLKLLKIEVENYYSNQNQYEANYEDLYYMASQIRDSKSKEYDNPAIAALYDRINRLIKPILNEKPGDAQINMNLGNLAKETTNYIADIVWHLLKRHKNEVNHLNCLAGAYRDTDISKIDIFTLNHDLMIEAFLDKSGISYIDGFSERTNDVRYWNPNLYDGDDFKINLFKLHGSINWFLCRPNMGSIYDDNACLISGRDPYLLMDIVCDYRPLILIGRFNKMLEYSRWIYSELYCIFHNVLKTAVNIIVSGYSFGDKGINNRLIEWMRSSRQNRLVVIHPKPKDIEDKARPYFANRWDDFVSSHKIVFIKKGIQDTSWLDIQNLPQIRK
ncbi:MAG: hypothetical protein CVT49_06845 [candidate division Zixibacteria bacterium HGW-Zixibacteria-1]|nr:MAG: hypothetical protein CVT49_06845 [candidate division Zixibacteria bacterium HGW-Zixibacteria-1]